MSAVGTDLVEAQWLHDNLDQVVVLDASFYLPTMAKNADAEFAKAHIPSAMRWDIDKIASASPTDLPHMMPSIMQIISEAQARGINDKTHIVVYDQIGLFSSPRLWFTFKTLGHERVSVLNGGLPAWVKAGFGTLAGEEVRPAAKTYTLDAKPGRMATCHLKTMINSLERDDTVILDARPEARYMGTAPEPRAGLTSGHMPHSQSTPFADFIGADHCMKSPEQIEDYFSAKQIDLSGQLITTCGSGVSAAVVNLALRQINKTALLYDGSWAEWGDPRNDLPIHDHTCKTPHQTDN